MNKKITLLLSILVSFWKIAIAQVPPPVDIPDEFKNYEFDHNGTIISYRLLTPEIAAEGQKLPLIVALHGMENFGATKDRFLEIAGSYALGWLAPAIQDKYPSYVIAPHLHYPLFLDEGYAGWEEEKSLDLLRQLIDLLLTSENIDPDRIYLTGHSVGGMGTFLVPKHLKDYFAALVPMNTAGGCPEVCDEVDNRLYDSLSIWGVHHRGDHANSNVRSVFTRLEMAGHEVYPTHSFGDEIINLPATRIEELIDEHQRYFHTEYRYSCNGSHFFCHTSATDTILQDTLFQKWLFRQHKIDPEGVAITSVDTESNYTVNWEAKNPADSVEVWFRSGAETKWLMLDKVVSAKRSFDLIPSVSHSDVSLGSKVRLVVINGKGFAYGFSTSNITELVTGIPEEGKGDYIITYPNPVANTVHLKMPGKVDFSNMEYRIVSSQGSIVRSGIIKGKKIDVTGLSAGIYLMVLQSDDGYFKKRLMIAN